MRARENYGWMREGRSEEREEGGGGGGNSDGEECGEVEKVEGMREYVGWRVV